jgi:molybdopterin synthase sulfur carrier subunit
VTVRLLYFAWVRERTGIGEEAVPLDHPIALSELVARLRALSDGHDHALADLGPLRAACNQDFVGWDHLVEPGDEIAIFPPVTGG